MIKMTRTVYFLAGLLSLGLGIAGIFLPLLPTTCFILLAAYCFSKSSERWYNYLISHRLFGPQIENWMRYGSIPMRIKILASTMMVLAVSYPLLFVEFHIAIKMLAAASVVVALIYIWTRPTQHPVATPIKQPANAV